MAFINVGKSRGFFNKDECDYGLLLSEFFGSSCAPGARDFSHNHGSNSNEHDSLCSLCRVNPPSIGIQRAAIILEGDVITEAPEPESESVPDVEGAARSAPELSETPLDGASPSLPTTCNADLTNQYYGNRGALRCLSEEGEVAILERQYLQEHATSLGLKHADFRVLCRNGSLAAYPGFDVDSDCLLTKIVDGEVVARRDSEKLAGTVNALISLDKYLQSDPKFKMFNHFNGVEDLLFKDTTFGLESHTSTDVSRQIQNYQKLFVDLEKCAQSSANRRHTLSAVMFVLFAVVARLVL